MQLLDALRALWFQMHNDCWTAAAYENRSFKLSRIDCRHPTCSGLCSSVSPISYICDAILVKVSVLVHDALTVHNKRVGHNAEWCSHCVYQSSTLVYQSSTLVTLSNILDETFQIS